MHNISILRVIVLLSVVLGWVRTPNAQSHTYIGPNGDCTTVLGLDANAWDCPFNWSAGTTPGTESTVVIGAALVEGCQSSESIAGLILDGTDLLTCGGLQVIGSFVWSGGDIVVGTFSIAGSATFEGSSDKNLLVTDLRIESGSVVTWTDGSIGLYEAAIDNHGTFDAQSDGSIVDLVPDARFINREDGLLIRSGGDGTSTMKAHLTNYGGRIDVRAGTLVIEQSDLCDGLYEAEAGATLLFAEGLHTVDGTLAGDPDGDIIMDNGSVLSLLSSTAIDFGGAGFLWRSNIVQAFESTLTNLNLLTMTGGSRTFRNGTFRNEGTVIWENGATELENSVFQNAGLVDLQGEGQAFSEPTGWFINENGATVRRSVSPNTASYEVSFVNKSGGLIEILSGTLWLNRPIEFEAGSRLEGVGTFQRPTGSAVFIDTGTTAPGTSPGLLGWDGDYEPWEDAVLEIELGGFVPGTDHDQLHVDGDVVLGGTLHVILDGGFSPQPGDRFPIIIQTPGWAISGTFDILDLPGGVEMYTEIVGSQVDLVIGTPVANELESALPTVFALHAAYPNPFNPQATLRYDVPETGRVRLVLYDVLGREVAVLLDSERQAGTHTAVVDAFELTSGQYLVRMTAEGFVQTRPLTLLR